jgi:endonuclease YncB( thermonuclease family)
MNKKHALLLSFLLTALIASTIYSFSLAEGEKNTGVIARVIDGDTLELEDRTLLRLINVNTPEKNNYGYQEAKDFLKQWENSSVFLELLGLDKYQRTLARVYAPEYLNLELVKQGLASKYLVHDIEKREFAEAEKVAIEQEKGMWKKSTYYGCFITDINKKKEFVKIDNSCTSINMKGWKLKDESRKVYTFPSIAVTSLILHTSSGKDNETDLFWNLKEPVWNDDSDSLYIFDSQGRLVHYESYGY